MNIGSLFRDVRTTVITLGTVGVVAGGSAAVAYALTSHHGSPSPNHGGGGTNHVHMPVDVPMPPSSISDASYANELMLQLGTGSGVLSPAPSGKQLAPAQAELASTIVRANGSNGRANPGDVADWVRNNVDRDGNGQVSPSEASVLSSGNY